jgi:hypothetical protein
MNRQTDLSAYDLEWLRNGGPFPEIFEVKTKTGSVTYRIMDRDPKSGLVSGLGERHGRKGFVIFVEDDIGEPLAAKFCLPADFEDKAPENEARLALRLRDADALFARPKLTGMADAFDSQLNKTSWVCFITDKIDGKTLKAFLRDSPSELSVTLALDIIHDMVIAANFLWEKGLQHDDLHWGNLMLRPVSPLLLMGQPDKATHKLTIIDTGSLKPSSHGTKKGLTDWGRISVVVAQLYNVLWRNRRVVCERPTAMKALKHFFSQISEKNSERQFADTAAIIDEITRIGRFNERNTTTSSDIFGPFDVLSAEQFVNDATLVKIFADNLPWFSDAAGPKPVVLTGPRGCGKSMVFRYLGAKTHFSNPESALTFLDNSVFIGIYISCSSELQGDFLSLTNRQAVLDSQRSTITSIFSIVLARELFRLIDRVVEMPEVSSKLGVGTTEVNSLVNFCRGYIGARLPPPVRLRVSSLAGDFSDELDQIKRMLSIQLARNTHSDDRWQLPDSFISELAKKFSALLQFKKPLCFLLDDYTSHRIPFNVQELLNPIIFGRHASLTFKVSSETLGFKPLSKDGLKIDAEREFSPVDAGFGAIKTDPIERGKFLTLLIDKRLIAAGFKGSTATLIGKSEFSTDVELAHAIRNRGVGKSYVYHGVLILSHVWSGDVATILSIVREMFKSSGTDRDTTELISAKYQHEAITRVSRGLVEGVARYEPFGAEMSAILSNFAELAAQLLTEGGKGKKKHSSLTNEGLSSPQRKYRIEMTKHDSNVFEQLDDRTKKIALELLRRAIFIDMGESRAKESRGATTLRWQLRPSLNPHFGLSFVRDSYLDLKDISDFKTLIENPEKFKNDFLSRYKNSSNLDLFPEELV